MRRGLLVVQCVALVLLGAVMLCSAEPAVLLMDDFDSYELDQGVLWSDLPVQFPLEGHFPAVVTNERAVSGEQSLLMSHIPGDAPGNIGAYLFEQFAPQKEVAVTLWVWVSGPGRAFTLSLGSIPADGNVGPGGAKTGVSLYFNNGTIQGYAGGWQNTGYRYPLSSWFQLLVEADTTQQNYRVYVRETAQVPWFDVGVIPFRNAVDNIEFVTITNYQAAPRSVEFYVDDVVVTTGGGEQ